MPQNDHTDWTRAWQDRYPSAEKAPRRRRLPRAPRGRARWVLVGMVLAVLAAPAAIAASGVGRFVSDDDRYTLLGRNTRDGDGGAVAAACNSDGNNEPCLNMVNKGNGAAAAFRTRGLTGFRLQTSGQGTATPFELDSNATGKVEFLNADQLDGLDSSAFRLWAVVDDDGTLARKSAATDVDRTGEGRYEVTFDRDVSDCAYLATIGEPTTGTPSAGEIGTSQSNDVNAVLVRTRDSDGTFTDRSFHLAVHC
jgi:hypothetical protein